MEKLKLLLIDDEALNDSLRDELELNGYSIVTAYTTKDGIENLESNFYNIVLLDMKLPDSGGIKVLEKIKEISPETEVILFTAFAATETVREVMDRNAFACLCKPFETQALIATLRKACEAQNSLFVNRTLYQQVLDAKKDWENTFNSISDLLSIYDKNFTLIKCNRAFIEKFKVKYEEIIGRNYYEIYYGNDKPVTRCPLLRCMKSLKPELEELEVPLINGNYMFSCFPKFNSSGKVTGFVHVARDITERKKAEEQIKQGLMKTKMVLDGVINALALLVEQRDEFAAGHQQRVSSLAGAIADEMRLPKDQADGIRIAGLVHNIGHLHIPAEFLNRNGKLNEIEFNLVKRHAQDGYAILKGIEFPWPVADIVHQHHERIGGSGYPLGLSNGDILMEAKILCVADVVVAMLSNRSYRSALGMDKALEELLKNKGVLYDSGVVDASLKVIKEKRFKFKSYDSSLDDKNRCYESV